MPTKMTTTNLLSIRDHLGGGAAPSSNASANTNEDHVGVPAAPKPLGEDGEDMGMLQDLVDLSELMPVDEHFFLDDKMLSIMDEDESQNSTNFLQYANLTPPHSPLYTTKCIQDIYTTLLNQQTEDIAQELAVVDELVRARIEDMQWANSSSSSTTSSSASSSPHSSLSSSSSSDDQYEEEPPPTPKTKRTAPNRSRSNHHTIDKKSRKKEQNKNAATRYRLKKKAQIEDILNEEKVLIERRNELQDQMVDVRREIKYLKGLMRDLFKAKGLLT